jgi:hypothetical protein
MNRPEHPAIARMRALYFGSSPPAVAVPALVNRLLSCRVAGPALTVRIATPAGELAFDVTGADDHRLSTLSAADRAQVHAALSALRGEGGADG